MSTFKEYLCLNESITFKIDLFDDVYANIQLAKDLGATDIKEYPGKTKGFTLTVKSEKIGKKILDSVYDLKTAPKDKKEEFYKRLK